MNSTIHDQAWLTWGANLETRIRQLEKHIHYPHNENAYVRGVDAMKEAAAKAQAVYIPGWPDVDPRQKYGDTRPASEQTEGADAKARSIYALGRQGGADPREKYVEQALAVINEAYPSQKAFSDSYGAWKNGAQTHPNNPPPMRADTEAILALTKFAKRLLNPEDLGHAVTFEVRQLARRALGLPEVKEYDL